MADIPKMRMQDIRMELDKARELAQAFGDIEPTHRYLDRVCRKFQREILVRGAKQ